MKTQNTTPVRQDARELTAAEIEAVVGAGSANGTGNAVLLGGNRGAGGSASFINVGGSGGQGGGGLY